MAEGFIANFEELRDIIRIEDIVGTFVKLKKAGANYSGLCPLHNEKSPSFSVNPAKGIFKCFGCGKGGDAITFLQEHEHLDFGGAVKWLAAHYNFDLKIEAKDDSPEAKKKEDEIALLFKVNQAAAQKYQFDLTPDPMPRGMPDAALKYALEERKLEPETIQQWQLGFAPEEWRFLTPMLIEKGLWAQGEELGLVANKSETNYDVFRNRLMIPIHNNRGEIVGFGGRKMPGANPDDTSPKYLNSKESRIFKKSGVLFGLRFAQDAIRKMGHAVLVEGYTDVISLHQGGANNTVGSCGTALTDEHCKLLSRYTKRVIVVRDGDKAGQKALMRDIDILLQHDFRVDCIVLPEDEDPDTFSRKDTQFVLSLISGKGLQSAPIYKADYILKNAGADADDLAMAWSDVAEMISKVASDMKRDELTKAIAKVHKKSLKLLEKEVASIRRKEEKVELLEDDEVALPAWVNKEALYEHGFDERKEGMHTGYYFGSSQSKLSQLTNFIITPLFHVISADDNKRMLEINNGLETKVIEMESGNMISLDQFRKSMFNQGYYITEGGFTQSHLQKIIKKVGRLFPVCKELTTLGWQMEGFWAYSNYAYKNELQPYDRLGIVEFNDKRYYSPSSSAVQADIMGADDDPFQNDRYLKYIEPAVNFKDWAELFTKVYGENGWMGIAWALLTVYRDIIMTSTKVPHLYGYGPVQAGKSEFGDSISNLFFHKMPAFNLNQGTDFAFFARMGRFRNCPNLMNEFDEFAIKEEWFRAIKGAYDGEGREKGRGGKGGKTKTQAISCTCILLGQYLSTKDDNSVLSRCIPLVFRERKFTPEEKDNFDKLKHYEEKGLGGILVEFFKLRSIVTGRYADTFKKLDRRIHDELKKEGVQVKTRTLKNVTAAIALVELLAPEVAFPFTTEDFFQYSKKMIVDVSNLISESNTLAEFWRTMEYLVDRGEIAEGCQYKVATLKEVSISVDREHDQRKQFDEPRTLLFIRLNIVHTLFAKEYKMKSGKGAPGIDTIKLYMKDQPYWVGSCSSSKFKENGKEKNTSCLVLDYDLIKVNLVALDSDAPEDRKEITVSGRLFKDAEKVGSMTKATLLTAEQKGFPLATVVTYYTCWIPNIAEGSGLSEGMNLRVTGWLSEKPGKGDRINRLIDVTGFEIVLSEAEKRDEELAPVKDSAMKF